MRATSGCAEGGSAFSAGTSALLLPSGDRSPIYVIVENVRSLFNVGAIFRSADAVRAAGVYLTGFTGRPPRQEIRRVALGAEDSVPWRYAATAAEVIAFLTQNGVTVYGLECTGTSLPVEEVVFRFPAAFVVGHEVEGVSEAALAACGAIVHLPMLGEKTSLNVSVAAGVMLYALLRAAPGQPDARR